MDPRSLSRRAVLAGGLAVWFAPTFARAAAHPRRPLVVVLLRGGLDGLAAVPPVGDAAYRRRRGDLALPDGAGLALDQGFALHPSLGFLHERWGAGEVAILHAAATQYRERSHFDGQDVLECGAAAHGSATGWLSRALPARGVSGVSVGSSPPLVLRGPGEAMTWSPSSTPAPDDDTLDHLADLYAGHDVLAGELAAARHLYGITGPMRGSEAGALVTSAAKLLLEPDGPEAAVVSISGWDTHANQGSAEGALARRLGALDGGLRTLHAALGDAWADTVVLVLTEFGRTVSPNGTGGTDHGTATAAFALGGAIRGGIRGDWPGLDTLYEGRDLIPANDVRGLVGGVLRDHWGAGDVFPGVHTLDDLIRV